jgi:cardiolipin synthase A/B
MHRTRSEVIRMAAPVLEEIGAVTPAATPAAHPTTFALTQVRAAGHDLQIFTESLPLIAAMVRDIQAARSRAWLESYIYLADAAGLAIGEALKERARAGLDVRLLYDALGSARTPESFFEDLRQAGVKVHAYNGLAEALARLSPQVLNRRDHRKILVIDDELGYFGGMNIVDQTGVETVAEAKARNLPASAGWRDVHVRLAGPKQAEMAAAFDRLWQRRHGKKERWPRWPVRQMLESRDEDVWFFDSRPGWRFRSPARVFLPLIERAQRDILLSMAYFLPVGRVLRALFAARRRGVAVRVILPAQNDVRLVRWATRHLYGRLLKRGVQIFERQDQMLHSKVMVVDDRWSVVGSCNFDPRSLWLNLEFLAVFQSAAMAEAIGRICDFEIGHSTPVTLEHFEKRTWWQRVLDRGAYSLRRWL